MLYYRFPYHELENTCNNWETESMKQGQKCQQQQDQTCVVQLHSHTSIPTLQSGAVKWVFIYVKGGITM